VNSLGNIIYNSNFASSLASKNYLALLSAGVSSKKLIIEGQVVSPNLKACSIQVYLNVYLGQSVNVLAHLPINYEVADDTLHLSSWETKGTLSFKSAAPLPQSSIITIN